MCVLQRLMPSNNLSQLSQATCQACRQECCKQDGCWYCWWSGQRLWFCEDWDEIWQHWHVPLDTSKINWGLYTGEQLQLRLFTTLFIIAQYQIIWQYLHFSQISCFILYSRTETRQQWLCSMVMLWCVSLLILILLWLVWGTWWCLSELLTSTIMNSSMLLSWVVWSIWEENGKLFRIFQKFQFFMWVPGCKSFETNKLRILICRDLLWAEQTWELSI